MVSPVEHCSLTPLPLTLAELLAGSQKRLSALSDTPALDAQVLIAHLLGKPRAWVLAHPEAMPSAEQRASLEEALRRLESGEPLPYLLGHWEFFGLDFLVTPATLIPRPETELLVEKALEWLQQYAGRRLAADIGTGCGCIAVALAAHVPDLQVLASDVSAEALAVARQNARRHALAGRIRFIQADLVPETSRPYDLVCANLPYIPTGRLQALAVYRKEPPAALDGGRTGLDLIGRLLERLHDRPQLLAPRGIILLEIEASQGDSSRRLARRLFPKAKVDLHRDLSGRDRLLAIWI